MTDRPPAFYALTGGGARDLWTLLHPPYTAWHLSYVAIGAAVAPTVSGAWLAESVVAFLLAMGVAAHALDELAGRPLGTAFTDRTLWIMAAAGLAGAIALGVHGTLVVSPWMLAFIAVGVFLVVAYNLELFGGRFHGDVWFALAWGGFPALTGYFAQSGQLAPEAVLVAGACALSATAQRRLSTPARALRRRTRGVSGTLTHRDGTRRALGVDELIQPLEGALRSLSVAFPLLAVGLVLARLL